MSTPTPTPTGAPRHILIAGGGMAAIETLLALRHLAGDRVEIDLMAAAPDFVYRPLAVVEPFGHEARTHRLPLTSITRDHGAGHVYDNLVGVDADARRVQAASGAEFGYDTLVVATGARAAAALPGAVSFHGPTGAAAYREVLADLTAGRVRSLAFVVPPGRTWPLPLYELALMTAAWLWERGLPGTALALVTPEREPLEAFGPAAGDSVRDLLDRHGIDFQGGCEATSARGREIRLSGGRALPADAAVALPRLAGPGLPGLPCDADGFVPVDPHGRVAEAADVFAAGDAAGWPVKHGGLAAQQADAIAEAIAAAAGAPVRPTPFRPVLRGVLLAGDERVFLRSDSRAGRTRSAARLEPLWWPPAKVAGRYLAPYLEARGIHVPADPAQLGTARVLAR